MNAPLDALLGPAMAPLSQAVRQSLEGRGLTFEGESFRFSAYPTLVDTEVGEQLAADSVRIVSILERCAARFSERLLDGGDLGPMAPYFGALSHWFGAMATEHRHLPHINLLRFDTIVTPTGARLLENNSACPGGVIHCGMLQRAWREAIVAQYGLEFPRPSGVLEPEYFLRTVDRMMSRAGRSGVLAVLHDRGAHQNEVPTLLRVFQEMDPTHLTHITGVVSADIREIECPDPSTPPTLDGTPIGLMYCKLPPMQLDPTDPGLRPWLNAVEGPHCDLLNSLVSMYVIESKSSLAAIQDPAVQELIGLTQDEVALVQNYYPRTVMMDGGQPPEGLPLPLVAKPTNLTRGEGVHLLGTEEELTDFLTATSTSDGLWIWQEQVPPPRRTVPDEDGGQRDEYFGVDAFVIHGEFAGLVGRSHSDPVFNVGNGGRENVVLLERDVPWN
ncbi:hypothetical protein [Kytococcus sedentarius]|uniref:hypothetical protein n=1 Tax=Kytococcus sedentarius TaxID=1276 RepID=UPI0035BC2F57